jgi:hypothetical protein
MPAVYSTIAAASSACRHVENPKKAAPLTAEQQKEKRDERQLKQARIDAYVEKWMEDTNNLANTMAAEFDLKPRYFLDIFFQGGARMITDQNALNPYNAFKNLKAAEAREGTTLWILYIFNSDLRSGRVQERDPAPHRSLRRVRGAHSGGEDRTRPGIREDTYKELPVTPRHAACKGAGCCQCCAKHEDVGVCNI